MRPGWRPFSFLLGFGFLIFSLSSAVAADPEMDRLLRSPVGKDWVTNGGNLTNQRYSTLNQINTSNVKQLKGAWMTRLKGCLLYTSDAADERSSVDLGGR